MRTRTLIVGLTFLGMSVVSVSARAEVVNVPVSSGDQADWSRSDGGTGTTMVAGGPSVWHSTFATSIPPNSTNISFTFDSFAVDDKGVVVLGLPIGDAVIGQPNGGAAGAGTFDFGDGSGSQAHTFVGFTPGTSFPLLDGETNFTLLVYVNNTGTSDPSADPSDVTIANPSSFTFSGTLTYETTEESVPALPGGWLMLLAAGLLLVGSLYLRRRMAT